ncbi:hypothetical protein WDZ92_40755 [Nostoc sp. NIES-2111]
MNVGRAMWRGMGALVVASVMAGTAVSAPALANTGSGKLSGEDLRDAVSGKRVYLAVPLGGEFPLYYQSNGRVDGSGEAVGLGRFLKPSDSGRWWVQGDRLCQKWQTWYEGKVFCFTVSRSSPGKIDWVRDDGMKGTARIAD